MAVHAYTNAYTNAYCCGMHDFFSQASLIGVTEQVHFWIVSYNRERRNCFLKQLFG
jgi:hypothetical protein